MSAGQGEALALLALAWLGYGVLHTLLASHALKRWVELHAAPIFPAYRLVYNAVAVLLLVPIAWLVLSHRGPLLWTWDGPARWLAHALALGALAALLVSFRYYDGGEFSGIRQWREHGRSQPPQKACLRLSPLHRYVRHPWYCASLVLIWTRDMDAAMLVSAVMVSAYFVVGARFEEAKLIVEFGAAYRHYMTRVAGLLPLPGRTLNAGEAARIEAMANAGQQPDQPDQPSERV
jgi:protein-S-isoprenylcysteine O-methyltransferase Ste14